MMRYLFFWMLGLSTLNSFGQWVLEGRVHNPENEPVAGATVVIGGSFFSTLTNEQGFFRFQGLKGTSVEVVVRYLGYKPLVTQVRMGQSLPVEMTLEPETILADEVIVQASRFGETASGAVSQTNRQELRLRNSGADMPYLLTLTPGMVVSSDAGNGVGYTNFRIRGTDMNRINITMNGIPLNDQESHGVWWVNMPDFASSVENVSITRGVGASTNGTAAFGASLNFRTAAPSLDPTVSLETAFGSFQTHRQSLQMESGLMKGRFSLGARISNLSSDGYIDRSFSKLASLFLNAGYFAENSLVRILFFSGRERTGQAWDGVPSDTLGSNRTYNGLGQYFDSNGNVRYYPNQTDNYRQDHLQIFHSRQWNSHFSTSLAFHFTHGNGYFEQFRQADAFSDYGLQPIVVGSDSVIQFEMGIGPDYFESGAITRTDLVRRKYLQNDYYGLTFSGNYARGANRLVLGGSVGVYKGNHFGWVVWAGFGGNESLNHEWYRSLGEKTDLNLFVKWSRRLGDYLEVFTDLQTRLIHYSIKGIDDDLRDISQVHRYPFLNPKAGLSFFLDPGLRIWLFGAVSHREPNRDNLTDANPAKPAPKPEVLRNVELGLEKNWNRFSLHFDLYLMDYRDQLVLTGMINDVGAPIMENVPGSFRRGAEWVMAFRPAGNLRMESNLCLNQSRIRNYVDFVDNWDNWAQDTLQVGLTEIAFSPSLTWAGLMDWEVTRGFHCILESQYVGSQFIDNTGNKDRRLDPWFVNNLRLNWEIGGDHWPVTRLSVAFLNVLNHQYESNAWIYRYHLGGAEKKMDGYFPQAGFHLMAGVQVNF